VGATATQSPPRAFQCASSLAQPPPQPMLPTGLSPLRASGADLRLGQPASCAVLRRTSPPPKLTPLGIAAPPTPANMTDTFSSARQTLGATLGAHTASQMSWQVASQMRASPSSIFAEMSEIVSQSRACEHKLRTLRHVHASAARSGGAQHVEPLQAALAWYAEERRQLNERRSFWWDRAWLLGANPLHM